MNITEQATQLCAENNASLLYLTKFGSHLYGTDTPNSDTDYKGLFLPSKESCFLGTMPKSITRSTGDPGGKNTADDTDLQLWSLQYFLELVSKGETNALDLLYSYTHSRCIEFIKVSGPNMNDIFQNNRRLFDITDCKAYTGYALGQAKKYGIKGSRLGVIKQIDDWLNMQYRDREGPMWNQYIAQKLSTIMPDILKQFQDPSYCFEKEINGVQALVVCGKVHLGNISVNEFNDRIEREYEQYGERARAAERNEGVDWKALSHAVRALYQMECLINFGSIEYPQDTAPVIKEIKQGKWTFTRVEQLITDRIEAVDRCLASIVNPLNKKDDQFIKDLILSFYESE